MARAITFRLPAFLSSQPTVSRSPLGGTVGIPGLGLGSLRGICIEIVSTLVVRNSNVVIASEPFNLRAPSFHTFFNQKHANEGRARIRQFLLLWGR